MFRVRRRARCFSVGLIAALSGCVATQAAERGGRTIGAGQERRPNVLLIVSDDQGYRDLGCYGGEVIQTPHLDRLAAEGARLTSFYVTWPACTPSRGSLLTGRYPQRNGTYDMYRNDLVDFDVKYDEHRYAVSPEMILGMDVREALLPAVLKRRGCVSGIFGKWDLGQLRRFLPLQRGFDEFYGFTNTGIDYWTHERYGIASMWRNNQRTEEDKGTYATDLFRREAVGFLNAHHDEPFFLYVPFNAPHGASNLERPRPGAQAPESYLAKYAGDDPKSRRTKFMAAVTCMDDAIGELLDRLDEHGLADNTLVIFLSDNGGGGGADNAPLRGRKGQMFEGGIRVPCLVRWPGRVPAGAVCDEFLTSLEIFPTILAVAGAEGPPGVVLDGFDMLPVLRGRIDSPRAEMFWQRRGDRAARVGKWKWVESSRGNGLFDLSADVGERRDLSADRPEVLKKVKARFAAWKETMAAAEPRRPFRDW